MHISAVRTKFKRQEKGFPSLYGTSDSDMEEVNKRISFKSTTDDSSV